MRVEDCALAALAQARQQHYYENKNIGREGGKRRCTYYMEMWAGCVWWLGGGGPDSHCDTHELHIYNECPPTISRSVIYECTTRVG